MSCPRQGQHGFVIVLQCFLSKSQSTCTTLNAMAVTHAVLKDQEKSKRSLDSRYFAAYFHYNCGASQALPVSLECVHLCPT